jgi:hypothetical protein
LPSAALDAHRRRLAGWTCLSDLHTLTLTRVSANQGFKSRAKAFSGGAAKMMFSGL